MRKIPKLFYEKRCWENGFDIVAGVDEAGRGPLAGPVTAAAVVLLNKRIREPRIMDLLAAVKDSKKLSAGKREAIFENLLSCEDIAWGCAMVSEMAIDRINIFEASKLAMAEAVSDLAGSLDGSGSFHRVYCLIDGNFSIEIPYLQESIVGGDDKVFSISAASIIAKVLRDRFMVCLDGKYPNYGFARHKGYATAFHRAALARFGPCLAHRRSFAPVARHFCSD